MKSSMYVIRWIGAVCLITACLCPVLAAEINPYVDPAWLSAQSAASQLGACKISVLQTCFWRDWMPIVVYKPLANSWTIFDDSGDVPKMIAFEESGKIEILDPDLFNNLLKYKGNE